MKLSICIPTYNRASLLGNCLNSILCNKFDTEVEFEVCVSDNASTDNTEAIIRKAQEKMIINYQKNSSNLGMAQNFLKAVSMAKGDFVWLLGDDDLIMPGGIQKLLKLINDHTNVDFFYINSNHLTTEYVTSFPYPFDIKNLPMNMVPFSKWPDSLELNFLDLIDPKYSFDFLGGIFLAVFKRKMWLENEYVLNKVALTDSKVYSHFDNTFPHIKIYSNAFCHSRAFFNSEALSVCLSGAREWAPMYPFIKSFRLVEALGVYRENGLGFWKYIYCKNKALNNFMPDLISTFVKKGQTGKGYINFPVHVLSNMLFPNFYFSFIYFVFRKTKLFMKIFQRA